MPRRSATRPLRPAGFTYLELVFVIIILSVLYVLGIDRLLKIRADAEAAALAYTRSGFEVALSLQLASLAAKGRLHEATRLLGANPVDWLAQPPDNYAGAFTPEEAARRVEPGQWWFDTRARELVYRVRFAEFFQPEQGHAPEVRLKIRLVYADNNRNGRFDRQKDDVLGVRLVTLTPYRWLDEPKTG